MQQALLTIFYNSKTDAKKAGKLLNSWGSDSAKRFGTHNWVGNFLVKSGTFTPEEIRNLYMVDYYVDKILQIDKCVEVSLTSHGFNPLIMWKPLLLNKQLPVYQNIDYYIGDWGNDIFLTNKLSYLQAYAFRLIDGTRISENILFSEQNLEIQMSNILTAYGICLDSSEFASLIKECEYLGINIRIRPYHYLTFEDAINFLESAIPKF